MKKLLLLGGLLLIVPRVALAQAGGNAGTADAGGFDGARSNYRDNRLGDPQQIERAKRGRTDAEVKDDGTSTFIDAAVLMNVKADSYVAVFALNEQGETPQIVNAKMDATVAALKNSLEKFGIRGDAVFLDFVSQSRVYEYDLEEQKIPIERRDDADENAPQPTKSQVVAVEKLSGFELKKNLSIRFKDIALLDKLVVEAAQSEIFDLVKVDYVVADMAALQEKLQAQTMAILKRKAANYGSLLGVRLNGPVQIVADWPSVYFPVEQYASYTAAASETVDFNYGSIVRTRQNARKPSTTYFKPLGGDGFDTVVNPIVIEPVVQFTTYLKVKYAAPKKSKK